MSQLSQAPRADAAVELRQGLAVAEVHARLAQGLRLQDTGQRILAFYLTEMSERRLYQATGHASTAQYAEDRLGMEPRRARELVAVGRKLLELPAIDRAFCAGRIGWSKVLQLARVVTPEHEAAWLERALALSCRDLALEVRLSKAGSAPREPGDRKGLPEIRFDVKARLDVLAWQKLELAKQKLSAERGRPVTDAELLEIACEWALGSDEDGSLPGRTPVDGSLYRIVVRQEDDALVADSELGAVPLDEVNGACVRCDAQAPHAPDARTPPALRRRVIARDGGRCRGCRSRNRLMVHHIRYRSRGGRTRADNLITLCVGCHALVHADLLVLRGERAARVEFVDADGQALGEPGGAVAPQALALLLEAPSDTRASAGSGGGERSPPPRPAPQAASEAFAGIVAQEKLLERLDLAATGSRARGRAFPHTLLVGPPGTGKTTLARGIAARMGSRLVETAGPLLQDVPGLLRLLARLEEHDVLFLDEVHAVPRPVLETLYQAMVEGPAITVLAATTEEGDLPRALLSRFGLRECLDFYAREDLAALVTRAAKRQGYRCGDEAALELAAHARGTPREALRLLERALDRAASEGRTALDRDGVRATLENLGYDASGLDPAERRYLRLLRTSADPVPLHRLARMLGASVNTLLNGIEPFLFRRGLVRMTPRGRMAVHRPQLLEA